MATGIPMHMNKPLYIEREYSYQVPSGTVIDSVNGSGTKYLSVTASDFRFKPVIDNEYRVVGITGFKDDYMALAPYRVNVTETATQESMLGLRNITNSTVSGGFYVRIHVLYVYDPNNSLIEVVS